MIRTLLASPQFQGNGLRFLTEYAIESHLEKTGKAHAGQA